MHAKNNEHEAETETAHAHEKEHEAEAEAADAKTKEQLAEAELEAKKEKEENEVRNDADKEPSDKARSTVTAQMNSNVRDRALNTAQAVRPMANQSRGRFVNAAQNRPAAGAPFDRRPMRA